MNKERIRSCEFLILAMSSVLLVFEGCASQEDSFVSLSKKNLVQAGNSNLVANIGNLEHRFAVLGHRAFDLRVATGEIDSIGSNLNYRSSKSLVFGMPKKMVNKPLIFGSVITKVSDKISEDLGGLKLADIPPIQVMPVQFVTADKETVVSLRNCVSDCAKTTEIDALINIPVKGIDSENVYLDLASLGDSLELTAIRRDDPALQKFVSTKSETVTFDFSEETLVFDVETHLSDTTLTGSITPGSDVVVTNRWYIKTENAFNHDFISRKATPGVGFFMTEKSAEPLIQHWDFGVKKNGIGLKYYIKHVPIEFQKDFSGSFDEWNKKIYPIIGENIFSYEFISEEDPRSELLVPGDVRYNIVEWDLVNKAGYGGLGPSVANQDTGEIFNANVLVQGPTIVEIYSKWFQMSKMVTDLRAAGRVDEAENFLSEYVRESMKKIKNSTARKFEMKFGQSLFMNIRAQQPSLEDSVASKESFDITPEGYTYDKYMSGYFHDMVTHELGHNLGLRHNFRGNFGASVEGNLVSRSVMEYLGRGYRYLDHVGEYDLMALAYGYTGALPSHTNWYCTDEDVVRLDDPSKSAECSMDDATTDPFGFFQTRLNRAIDLLVARGRISGPEWLVDDDIKVQLSNAIKGMAAYAESAEQTGSQWSNFFGVSGRPQTPSGVKAYVLTQLKAALCDSSLVAEADKKASADDKKKVLANILSLRSIGTHLLKTVFTPEELACSSSK